MNEQVTPKKRGRPLGVKTRSPEHKQALVNLKEAQAEVESLQRMLHVIILQYAALIKTGEVKRTFLQRLVYLFKGV